MKAASFSKGAAFFQRALGVEPKRIAIASGRVQIAQAFFACPKEFGLFHAGDAADGAGDLHRQRRPTKDGEASHTSAAREQPFPEHHLSPERCVLAAREIDSGPDLRRVWIAGMDLLKRVDEVAKRVHGAD